MTYNSRADDEVLEAAKLERKLDLYCAALARTMEAETQESSQQISQASLDTNSGTSKEQANDDGDLEENTDPTNARRLRRMLSNRESARRSRKRKQAHLDDLKSQVSMLMAENASLVKRLADVTQKYMEATIDNRNLIFVVHTLRTKLNIAEEAVRRVTGTSLLLLPTTFDMAWSSMPFNSYLPYAASAGVLVEESMNNVLQ